MQEKQQALTMLMTLACLLKQQRNRKEEEDSCCGRRCGSSATAEGGDLSLSTQQVAGSEAETNQIKSKAVCISVPDGSDTLRRDGKLPQSTLT